MNHGYEAESSGANLNCEQPVDMQITATTSVACSTPSNLLPEVKSTDSLYFFYCLLCFLIHWFIFQYIKASG